VVLIGSTIGGQWWGRDTDFCISTIENNLYSSYATEQKIDPYFIIDKLAQSSDPMRKFTIAIQYDVYGSGEFKISNDSYTMTDARNIGISLNSIQAALGKDYNKVFESIMQDAGSRKENIGTIAFTAGFWFTSNISAVVPLYEIPNEPTVPEHHGWLIAQLTTSSPSLISSILQG
jgi:hypothetical protein